MENIDTIAPDDLRFDLIWVSRDHIWPILGGFFGLHGTPKHVIARLRGMGRIRHLMEHVDRGIGLGVSLGGDQSGREDQHRGAHTYIDCCATRPVTPRD